VVVGESWERSGARARTHSQTVNDTTTPTYYVCYNYNILLTTDHNHIPFY